MFALLWTVSSPPDYLSDFHKAYYPAGDAILHDRAHLYTKINPVTGYVNIPIVALLFVPLSQLTRHSADAVMTAIDLIVALGAFAGLAAVSRLRGPRLALLGALFLANGPLYYSVREGNLTHFTLLLTVGALWCIDTKRGGLLGVLLATAAILKPPMILLAVPFLLRRTPRFLTGLAVTLAAVAVVSVVIFGIDLHLTWYRDTVAPYSRHPLGAYNVQSVDGFLARLFVGDHLTDWSVIESGALAFTVARLAFAAAVAVACFAVAWRARASSRRTSFAWSW